MTIHELLSGILLTSVSLIFLLWFCHGYILLSPHFVSLCLFVSGKSITSPAIESNGSMKKRSYGPMIQCPLFTRTSCVSGVSYVGCVHTTVVADSCLPSVQLAAMAHFACCGMGFSPLLLRGLYGAVMGLYLFNISRQTRCLPLAHLPRWW